MDIKEAYSILGVDESISDEELKKKYKELAYKYHPDRNKDEPDKLKSINEAHQLIQNYKKHPEQYQQAAGFHNAGFWGNFQDIGDVFFNATDFFNKRPQISNINLSVDISFHEAVLGCSKEISYNRNIKCNSCKGAGHIKTGNGCTNCDGFGRTISSGNGMIIQSSCNKCFGRGVKQNKCNTCNSKGHIEEKRTGNINIASGTKNGEILRLISQGNFAGSGMLGDTYSDVFITVNVAPYQDMSLKDKDVHSTISISLLEALKGVDMEIETVYGKRDITIPPKSKHCDQIKIGGCGVKNSNGYHIVNLNLKYPEDTDAIIKLLSNE